MKRDKLILLVGASGSGKTAIAKHLEGMGYNIIKSYTTREPREENEWGHTFIRINKDWGIVDVDGTLVGFENFYPPENERYKYIDIDDMIALQQTYSDDIYFATKEQYQGKGTSIYIVCPDGAEQVRENVKDAEVVTIFLMADEEIRYERVRDRGFENNNIPIFIPTKDLSKLEPSMEKVLTNANERIEKDRLIFSTCKCNYVVDGNRSLPEVVADIKEIIGG